MNVHGSGDLCKQIKWQIIRKTIFKKNDESAAESRKKNDILFKQIKLDSVESSIKPNQNEAKETSESFSPSSIENAGHSIDVTSCEEVILL